jgi:hypothetical protein
MKEIRNQKSEKKQNKKITKRRLWKPFSPAPDAAHSPTNLT